MDNLGEKFIWYHFHCFMPNVLGREEAIVIFPITVPSCYIHNTQETYVNTTHWVKTSRLQVTSLFFVIEINLFLNEYDL